MQAAEDARQRDRVLPVDDEPAQALLAVEAPVRDRDEAQAGERYRAAGPPGALLEQRLDAGRQLLDVEAVGVDPRLGRLRGDERERDEHPHHHKSHDHT